MEHWTNESTRRVYLEFFHGVDLEEFMGGMEFDSDHCAETMMEWVEECVSGQSEEGAERDAALAQISDVDWQNIAEHMMSEQWA